MRRLLMVAAKLTCVVMIIAIASVAIMRSQVAQAHRSSHHASAQSILSGPPCHTWQIIPSPNMGSYGSSLSAVTMVSSTDAWAVGAYMSASNGPSRTLIEHWNGSQWTVVPSPNASSYDNVLWDVAAGSATNIWAVGYSSSSSGVYSGLIEHWNGAAWTVMLSPGLPGNTRLLAVTTLGTTAWAVGEQYGSPYSFQQVIESWNGSSWALAQPPTVGAESELAGVAAVSDGTVWASGTYLPVANSTIWQTLIEQWNGTSWIIVPSPNDPNYSDGLGKIIATSPTNAWATGGIVHNVFNTTFGMMAHWDGSAWKIVTAQHIGSSDTNNVLSAVAPLVGGGAITVGVAYAGAGFQGSQTVTEIGNSTVFQLKPTPVRAQDVGESFSGVAGSPQGDMFAVGAAMPTGQTVMQTFVERYGPGQC